MDKREVAFTAARQELLHELLRAGAFDMDAGTRRDFVASTVRQIAARHPELDDHLTRQLTGEGMRARYGDATVSEAARHERGIER